MRLTAPASARQLDLGLALLRIVTGLVFVAHGGQKIFVWGFEGVATGFAGMGIPLAAVAGPAVALLEFLGGFALIAGLLTRVVAAGLAVTMIGALFMVHLAAGFFLPNGYEFVLALFAMAATLVLTGAGRWSLDGLIEARRTTPIAGDTRTLRRAA